MKWSFGAALGLVAALGFGAPARAAFNAYLLIDGVQGESQQHPGAIELTSWSFGTERGGPVTASSGRGAGGPTIREITIQKLSDKSSPTLMQASASGRHFKTMTLYDRKAGGSQEPYLELKMMDVLISHYQMSGGGERPTETLTLNFTKVETVYHPQTQDAGVTRASTLPSASLVRPTVATANGYLRIEGVKGESQDDRHKDWIEISSFNIGAHGGGTGGGAGRGTVSPTGGEITVTKQQDAASPKLFEALHNGTHIPKVMIELSRPTSGSPMAYELTDVMISSYQMGSGGRSTETLKMRYRVMAPVDQPQDASQPPDMQRGVMTPRAAHLPPPGNAY